MKIYDEFSPHFCLEGCRQTQLHGSAGARHGGAGHGGKEGIYIKIKLPMLHIHIKAMVFGFAGKVRYFLREKIGVVGALNYDALTGELECGSKHSWY